MKEFICNKCQKQFFNRFSYSAHRSHCGKNRKNYLFNNSNRLKSKENFKKNRLQGIKVKGHKHTEESKEKIRKKRFEYLLLKTGTTAWERRSQGKMSKLEEWFYDNLIVKYNLCDKYDIINEYPEYPYFIDFAFLNIKLAVELDGSCHFINEERIFHDLKKNNNLISLGWKIYRISGKPSAETELDFLKYLYNFDKNEKILESKLYKGSIKKLKPKRNRKEYFNKKEINYNLSQEKYIIEIINSNIDFTKLGWVNKVAIILQQKPQKVNKWMKRFMKDFYETQCFKRTLDKR